MHESGRQRGPLMGGVDELQRASLLLLRVALLMYSGRLVGYSVRRSACRRIESNMACHVNNA